MNYFAHATAFLDRPYFVAGTGVPDWLVVADRRCRVRSRSVRPLLDDADPRIVATGEGILQHIADDARFHQTRAFFELTLAISKRAREALGPDTGFRPSFLGHLLVEVLLDATLIADDPDRLEEYYRVLDEVDASLVQRAVNRVATRPTDRLAALIDGFHRQRILSNYLEDDKLLVRINQVMRRVGFSPLGDLFLGLLPELRRLVASRVEELLEPVRRDNAIGS